MHVERLFDSRVSFCSLAPFHSSRPKCHKTQQNLSGQKHGRSLYFRQVGVGGGTTNGGREGRQAGREESVMGCASLAYIERCRGVAKQLQQCRGAFRLVLLFDRGMSVCMMQDF
jgi:hypothetical protein